MAYDVISRKEIAGVWCCGIGDEVGFDVALKDKKALLDKVDDLRYDVRRAGGLAGAAVIGLAGAVALTGLAMLWNVTVGLAVKKGAS